MDENIAIAHTILEQFVRNFLLVFGESSISHNVYNLLHLAESVEQVGALQNVSAYEFKNRLQILKKYAAQPSKILQQVFNKLKLKDKVVQQKYIGFKMKNKDQMYSNKKFLYTTKSPDNYCYIKPGIPFRIKAFNLEEKTVIGNRLNNKTSSYEEPLDSEKQIFDNTQAGNSCKGCEHFRQYMEDVTNKMGNFIVYKL